LDYANLHMRSYMIQYPPTYVNHGSIQRTIGLDNNLVGSASINSKRGHKDSDESKYSQPRWCPSGLTHTKKEDCNGCRSKDQWSNEQRLYQQDQPLLSRYGDRNKLFHELRASL
jgi:hypothetical protein